MRLTYTVKSSDVVKGQITSHGFDHDEYLDMRGDPRLDKLADAVQNRIRVNKWRIPQDEEKIVECAVHLSHDPQFFGPYNKPLIQKFIARDKLEAEMQKLSTSKAPGSYEKVAQLLKQEEALNAEINAVGAELDKLPLKDVPTGQLICKQKASALSYALQKVHLPNHLCIGVGVDAETFTDHCFVQLDGSGAIAEATTDKKAYYKNLSHQRIADGGIALVLDDRNKLVAYGGGNLGFFDESKARHSADPKGFLSNIVFAQIAETLSKSKEMPENKDKNIHAKMEEALAAIHQHFQLLSQQSIDPKSLGVKADASRVKY